MSVVRRFPHATVVDSYIKDIRLTGKTRRADGSASAERSNHSPAHSLENFRIWLRANLREERTKHQKTNENDNGTNIHGVFLQAESTVGFELDNRNARSF